MNTNHQNPCSQNPAPAGPDGVFTLARNTSQIFFSSLAVQVATFAVLATAGRVLPVEEFARLSLIVAATMFATIFFDVGLGLTTTKHFGDTRNEAYLRTAFAGWLLMLPTGGLIGVGVWLSGLGDIALGIVLGALLNMWNGVRVVDQALQNYRSFTRASLAFAAIRLVAGLGALMCSSNPLVIAVSIYLLPVLAAPISMSFQYAVSCLQGARIPIVKVMPYAVPVYVNALAFVAAPYVPQLFFASRLDAVAIGTYGLIMTYSAPIALVVNSLYNALLPAMLKPGSNLEARLWSRRGLGLIAALWVAMFIGSLVVALALQWIYGHRFPALAGAFVVFFAAESAASLMGLLTLSVHTQSVPHLSSMVSIGRLAGLVGLLTMFGHSINAIVVLTSLMLLLGQLGLISLLAYRRYT